MDEKLWLNDPATLIARWREEYLRANGREAPAMKYERGWFILRGVVPTRYRKLKIVSMIELLTTRPDALAPSPQQQEMK